MMQWELVLALETGGRWAVGSVEVLEARKSHQLLGHLVCSCRLPFACLLLVAVFLLPFLFPSLPFPVLSAVLLVLFVYKLQFCFFLFGFNI